MYVRYVQLKVQQLERLSRGAKLTPSHIDGMNPRGQFQRSGLSDLRARDPSDGLHNAADGSDRRDLRTAGMHDLRRTGPSDPTNSITRESE